MASDFAMFLGKKTADDLTPKWFFKFKKRHPDMNLRKNPEFLHEDIKVQMERASRKENIVQYFRKLKEAMNECGVSDKPHLIYSVDEKQPGSHNIHNNLIPPAQSKTTTLICCGNASGHSFPPFLVIPNEMMSIKLVMQATPGTTVASTPSGKSNTKVFKVFLKQHFLKYVKPTPEEPVLLIYSGRKSQISMEISELAITNNIRLFLLPAHTSRFLQPLDAACFGPLDESFLSSKDQVVELNQTGILPSWDMLLQMTCKAYKDGMKNDNLKTSFRETGIYPLVDIDAPIDESIFTPSNDKVEGTQDIKYPVLVEILR